MQPDRSTPRLTRNHERHQWVRDCEAPSSTSGFGIMKFGFPFVSLHPGAWAEVARVADEAGFESCWIADHLVFPVEMEGTLGDLDH